ncbi:MAG TPA: MBL fold metallo-hydrolase [Casimicrobiaceae bacterium]|nr:MBL fold metallo-hydrolase [Casimicrobiaceae bacterium]
MAVRITYIGGPTALIEIDGLRLLTDPTFDPAGTDYFAKGYTLHKTTDPALDAAQLGSIDAVLLSHDHHADNLDTSGREFLSRVPHVLTTRQGAERLGGNARGLAPWERFDLDAPDGKRLRVVATPARHGPVNGDRGPVIGFALAGSERRAVYVSGDTVWYEGVAEVARRFSVGLALLFMGAARVSVAGPAHLTLTASEAVTAAQAFDPAIIVPLHYEGWQHFSESRADVDTAFARHHIADRLAWLTPGAPHSFDLEPSRKIAGRLRAA